MKLSFNNQKINLFIKFFCLFLVFSVIRPQQLEKLLFEYDLSSIEHDPKHVLKVMDYKNIQFLREQVVVYKSTNPNDPISDGTDNLTHYLLTIRTEQLDTPCINKSFACTYSEFKKEFSMFYPEINYDIPKTVLSKIGDANKVDENCLVIIIDPVLKLERAAWICHGNSAGLSKINKILSDNIREANKKNMEFDVYYIQNLSEVVEGRLYLTTDDWTFKKGDEAIVAATWVDTQPFSSTTYMKEQIEWKGSTPKPEEDRCFKIYRKKEIPNKNPDFFCVYVTKEQMQNELSAAGDNLNPEEIKTKEIAMSRFIAQTYVNKINARLHEASVKESLNQITSLPQHTLNIDSDLIAPIKSKVRDEYLKERHNLLNDESIKSKTPAEIGKMLDELKAKTTKDICKGNEICVDAINFCIDKGMLPLSGEREKFSMDKENPFNNIVPKTPIQINVPNKDSLGRKVVDEVAKLKGTKEYFAEKLPEGNGSVPLHDDIKKAFNTLSNLKESKPYENIEELKKGCKVNERNNIGNIRRKLSFMMYSGENDIFFSYFGYLRDYQFRK